MVSCQCSTSYGMHLCPSRNRALKCIFWSYSDLACLNTKQMTYCQLLGLLLCLDNIPNNGKLLPSKGPTETTQRPCNAQPDFAPVMSTHHPALAEARSGTGLSPLLAKVFYDKIPDKMETPQGWPHTAATWGLI